jgi:hypothetical protein
LVKAYPKVSLSSLLTKLTLCHCTAERRQLWKVISGRYLRLFWSSAPLSAHTQNKSDSQQKHAYKMCSNFQRTDLASTIQTSRSKSRPEAATATATSVRLPPTVVSRPLPRAPVADRRVGRPAALGEVAPPVAVSPLRPKAAMAGELWSPLIFPVVTHVETRCMRMSRLRQRQGRRRVSAAATVGTLLERPRMSRPVLSPYRLYGTADPL